MDSLVDYVKEKQKLDRKEYLLFRNIQIWIKDELSPKINMLEIINKIENTIDKKCFNNIEEILIGEIPDLEKRKLDAEYKDGCIYISNSLTSNEEIIENIIHETGHSLEETYNILLYSDRRLEREFISKRVKLYYLLRESKFEDIQPLQAFLNIDYSLEFDKFLYHDIGYDSLNIIISEFFPTPYSITSLREYYATGFEDYIVNGGVNIETICPILFDKLIKMFNEINKENKNE